MKILWITNILLPDISNSIGLSGPVTGGWMHDSSKNLVSCKNVELAVASTYNGKDFVKIEIDNIIHYAIPHKDKRKYPKSLEPTWRKICDDFTPDIIHIHGTEFLRALSCMRACPQYKYVVSIQGLVSVYYRYQLGNIPQHKIRFNITLNDFLFGGSIMKLHRNTGFKGKFEPEYCKRADVVVGRTRWDKVHTICMGTKKYCHNNESLRKEFYTAEKWNMEKMNKNTIFLSQGGTPIKALHQVLKACAILQKEIPDIQIRVGGTNIIRGKRFVDNFLRHNYGQYIYTLLSKYNLWKNIEFLGNLNAFEMIREYQKANVFVCPSSIENSPNSLGEAQLIGTPCVASYVGGVPDMVMDGETGLLYRFEEYEMLADNIRRIINDAELAYKLSQNEIVVATKRHDREKNLKDLLNIYQSVL